MASSRLTMKSEVGTAAWRRFLRLFSNPGIWLGGRR